jgi:hypothetical protein
MKDFIDDKCDPPDNWKVFDEWANKDLPKKDDYKGPPTLFQDIQNILQTLFPPSFPLSSIGYWFVYPTVGDISSGTNVTSTVNFGKVISNPVDANDTEDDDVQPH